MYYNYYNVNLEEPASIHTGWTPRVACKVSKKPAKKYDESNPMPKSRKRVEVCCLKVVLSFPDLKFPC